MTGALRLTLESLREAIRKRVEETSLRATADEIGLTSYTALGRFIRGETSSPQRTNRDLMTRWYYKRGSGNDSTVPREDVETALSVLRTWVGDASKSKSVRERRRREVLDGLEDERD